MTLLHDMTNEGLAGFPDGDYCGRDRLVVAIASRLLGFVAAHNAEIIAQAKREQMEADLVPIVKRREHAKKLGNVPTEYALQHAEDAIRAAWAEDHPEEKQ